MYGLVLFLKGAAYSSLYGLVLFSKGAAYSSLSRGEKSAPLPGSSETRRPPEGRRVTSKSGSHTTIRTTVVNRRSMSWADARKVEVEEEGQERWSCADAQKVEEEEEGQERWSWVHARKEEVEEEER